MARVNRLADESSPYLRQHQDNPVDWYGWGDAAFAAARERDRPILLSVGYSACHWCHVMAHECFEDDDVAAVMNEKFVNIKVDREERPDVDALYMDAVQAINGHGGWPMTVFCLPDARPFFGGTYFPKTQFLQLLAAVDEAWQQRRPAIEGQAEELTIALRRGERLAGSDTAPSHDTLEKAIAELATQFDSTNGGFGGAPKFPQAMSLDLALRAHRVTGDARMLELVTTSLDAMAAGGIYDHLGGGFARYSTDAHWLVPHFEKMLYDQALLVRVYLHAYQLTGAAHDRQILEETVAYVRRDLGQPDGGFSCAEDADSPDEYGHGHEGLFYVWSRDQLATVLDPDELAAAERWWGVTARGNFEGTNILHRPQRGEMQRPAIVERARTLLFEKRRTRPRPGLDDKVLTEWNALFVASLAEAALVLDRSEWLDAATGAAEFLTSNLRRADGRWLRSWQRETGARHLAFAADYAALVEAFVRLAEASGRARWIDEARTTADELLDLFWDAESGGVFTTGSDGEALVVRQKDLLDNATPSANSLAAYALLRLAALTGEARYANHADQILTLLGGAASSHPTAFAHALAALDFRQAGATEIAITGDRADLVRTAAAYYLPNAVLTWGERFESPLWEHRRDGFAYVCQGYICLAPASTTGELAAQLAK